jgi:hypothetical protein
MQMQSATASKLLADQHLSLVRSMRSMNCTRLQLLAQMEILRLV